MTERSRPPGLDTFAEEGLKLGARLAVGLLAVPLMGLSLLAPRAQRTAAPRAIDGDPASASPDVPSEPVSAASERPAAEGPAQAEVESALRKLTDATIGKAEGGKRARTKPVEKADRTAALKPAQTRTRQARSAEAMPHPGGSGSQP